MKKIFIVFILLFLYPPVKSFSYMGVKPEHYLILDDIPPYALLIPPPPENDFGFVREDESFVPYATKKNVNFFGDVEMASTSYLNEGPETEKESFYERKIPVNVEVTAYTKLNQEKFLLHDFESRFREARISNSRFLSGIENKEVEGIKLLSLGKGENCCAYGWMSNKNVIVHISTKRPEVPIAVIKAYNAKFPSTYAPLSFEEDYNKTWVRDEIEMQLMMIEYWFTRASTEAGTGEVFRVGELGYLFAVRGSFISFIRNCQTFLHAYGDKEIKYFSELINDKKMKKIEKELKNYRFWWEKHKNDNLVWPKN